jgi:hypothetical protein
MEKILFQPEYGDDKVVSAFSDLLTQTVLT